MRREVSSNLLLGEIVDGFVIPPHPRGIELEGKLVMIQPLSAKKFGAELYEAYQPDPHGNNRPYLPSGPFSTQSEFLNWLRFVEDGTDPVFFAIINKTTGKAVGVASFLRIHPQDGTIEVGHLNYSPLLQRTTEATEAMFLMMKWAFENGYRRYEWKCNALNINSRRAAQRLGFSYEGTFRQALIIKGRNRDTAWFAVIDKEWENLEQRFLRYLSEENFDENRVQKSSLASLTKPLLYKVDELE